MKYINSSIILVILSVAIVALNGVILTSAQNAEVQPTPQVGVSRLGSLLNINVPVFYEMVKNGNSMGINVLRGLVMVEKGDEASRSGLQGARPLSVRVFGIPVYERGQRHRSPPNQQAGQQLHTIITQDQPTVEYHPNNEETNTFGSTNYGSTNYGSNSVYASGDYGVNTADEVPVIPKN